MYKSNLVHTGQVNSSNIGLSTLLSHICCLVAFKNAKWKCKKLQGQFLTHLSQMFNWAFYLVFMHHPSICLLFFLSSNCSLLISKILSYFRLNIFHFWNCLMLKFWIEENTSITSPNILLILGYPVNFCKQQIFLCLFCFLL